MYNQRPGSFRGNSDYDLAGPTWTLERVRNRVQDHYTGNEEAVRAEEEAIEMAAERRNATRQAREGTSELLSEQIHRWWSRYFHGS